MNEFLSIRQLYRKDPAKNCLENDDGETIDKHFLDEYEWIIVSQLYDDLRPVGPIIATMEASEKVTSSLVIPMIFAIIHDCSKEVSLLCYSYGYGELSEEVVEDKDLCEEVRMVRHKLYLENKYNL